MESGKQTCLICLKNNYDEKSLTLYDMGTVEWENLTYLNKLEFVLNAEIVVYDSTSICGDCLSDLNKAYDFKERVAKALEYWSVKFEENIIIDQPNEVIDIINEESALADVNTYSKDEVIENCPGLCVVDNTIALNNDNKDLNKGSPLASSFVCHKCNSTFLTASELINHSCSSILKVENKEEQPEDIQGTNNQTSDFLYCELCKLEFAKSSELNKHLKIHENDNKEINQPVKTHVGHDKKYSCTFCNRAFKQSYHLREHLTSHTGEHNFKCNVCGKTFQRISSQRRHVRTHDALPGQKSKKSPFLCNICGKRFPYSNGAQRHMRIHSGDRRYECKVCTRKFSQSTHLKVHLRTHTGERPYMCNTCGESFSIKASLHKHMKGHSDSKDDIKILHNLEPNLSRTESTEDSDDIKTDSYIDEMAVYDS